MRCAHLVLLCHCAWYEDNSARDSLRRGQQLCQAQLLGASAIVACVIQIHIRVLVPTCASCVGGCKTLHLTAFRISSCSGWLPVQHNGIVRYDLATPSLHRCSVSLGHVVVQVESRRWFRVCRRSRYLGVASLSPNRPV
ncbi:hypothetical protein GQ43DRAFT_230117 [Delitschia confertaspora ATCC 74209]|uniref:Uncharacterized protein n=1 Tax=Delitschia confertaspora ATCC 74209 TaxID=1513339 RepID=A0A9P4JES4_9PLEO|nr:hypothetical protein GQ43DRAFT_230117 [Delitschia confertaspora ATCC 74209]